MVQSGNWVILFEMGFLAVGVDEQGFLGFGLHIFLEYI